jgi:hypothetical protein
MSVYIDQIQNDRHGIVDDIDRERAIDAAEAVLSAHGLTSTAAYAEYTRQWDAYDDEEMMHGAARIWCDAQAAANVALTSTWANPADVFCWIAA